MNYLERLRKKYVYNSGIKPLFAFRDAFKRATVSKKQSLIDLTVVAANLSPQIFWEDETLDPLVLRALNETNPTFDLTSLSSYSDEQMLGVLNSTKGKYFEYLVEDRLNAGEIVGDVVLPDGYHAAVAPNLTQPGWDIQIFDQHGGVADYLQLKATNSISYIHETLERYPDITVLGTSEIADKANGLILDSNITEQELTEQISDCIADMDPDFISDFLDAFNPLIPLVFILATEGYRMHIGKSSIDSLYKSIQHRVERTIITSGVGAIVYAIGGGWWLSLPSVFIAGAMYNNYIDESLANYNFDKTTSRLKQYRNYQKQQILKIGA